MMRDAIYGGCNFTDSLSEEIETEMKQKVHTSC